MLVKREMLTSIYLLTLQHEYLTRSDLIWSYTVAQCLMLHLGSKSGDTFSAQLSRLKGLTSRDKRTISEISCSLYSISILWLFSSMFQLFLSHRRKVWKIVLFCFFDIDYLTYICSMNVLNRKIDVLHNMKLITLHLSVYNLVSGWNIHFNTFKYLQFDPELRLVWV